MEKPLLTKEYLTAEQRLSYNVENGNLIKCTCGRTIGFFKDGKAYFFCHGCKGAISIKGKSN